MIAIASLKVRLPSMANARMNRFVRARLIRDQRAWGWSLASKNHKRLPLQPGVSRRVVFVRTGPRKLDDDNLAHAFKGVRDGFAQFHKIDDGDDRWEWVYDQEKGPYGIRAELEAVR